MAVPSSGDPRHPLPGTGPYRPPLSAVPMNEPANSIAGARQLAYLHAGSAGGFADLVDILRAMYPPAGGPTRTPQIGKIIANNLPVADRQRLTMTASPWEGKQPGDKFTFRGLNGIEQGYLDEQGLPRNMQGERLYGPDDPIDIGKLRDALKALGASGDWERIHPLPNTGDYHPPFEIHPEGGPSTAPLPRDEVVEAIRDPAGPLSLIDQLARLYPNVISQRNSQAIGDRSPTTMTNPLPGYRPTTMVNTAPTRSIATMINQHLARPTRPLVNTPLAGTPLTMGRR